MANQAKHTISDRRPAKLLLRVGLFGLTLGVGITIVACGGSDIPEESEFSRTSLGATETETDCRAEINSLKRQLESAEELAKDATDRLAELEKQRREFNEARDWITDHCVVNTTLWITSWLGCAGLAGPMAWDDWREDYLRSEGYRYPSDETMENARTRWDEKGERVLDLRNEIYQKELRCHD